MSVKVIKKKRSANRMTSSIESMHKDIKTIRSDLEYIRRLLDEDFELSSSAKRQLSITRKTPLKEYADVN